MPRVLPDFRIDSGYPPPKIPWYGLWCPLLDCFLWISYDKQKLQLTQSLTLSKILTIMMQLAPELYEQNIIDNAVCTNWTLVDAESVNFTLVLKRPFDQITVNSLQPSGNQNNQEALDVQKWFALTWHCLDYMKNMENTLVKTVCQAFDLKYDHDIGQELAKIILLEQDPDLARIKIQNLFAADV